LLATEAFQTGQTALARGDIAEACRWLGRARRLAPSDPAAALALASLAITAEPGTAIALAREVLSKHDWRDAWVILAAAHYRAQALAEAAAALHECLSRFACDANVAGLADAIIAATNGLGWGGVDLSGRVWGRNPGGCVWRLYGKPVVLKAGRLPSSWRAAPALEIAGAAGQALTGSPVQLSEIRRVEGVVLRQPDGSATGWALAAAEPGQAPRIFLTDGKGVSHKVKLAPGARAVPGLPGVPFQFAIPAEMLRRLLAPVIAAGGHGARLHGTPRPDKPKRAPAPLAQKGAFALVPLDDGNGDTGGNSLATLANAGIRAAAGRDVVLLRRGAVVSPQAIKALRKAAYATQATGMASALGNLPGMFGGSADGSIDAAAVAARANRGRVFPVPSVNLAACYLRADCLAATGLFHDEAFGEADGAEADFAMRAAAKGWGAVIAADAWVTLPPPPRQSPALRELAVHNQQILARRHKSFPSLAEAYAKGEALATARRRLAEAVWQSRPAGKPAILLITHDGGGGVGVVVAARARYWAARGKTPVILRADAGDAVWQAEGLPPVRYRLPRDLRAFRLMAKRTGVERLEYHHTLGHDASVLALPRQLGVEYAAWVHDYAHLCPQVTLSRAGRYCGEPDIAGCNECVATHGSKLGEAISVARLRARSDRFLRGATSVVVPSADAKARLRRYFPQGRISVKSPEPGLAPACAAPVAQGGIVTVAAAGAIGLDKGYQVLLDCARAAAAERLLLRYLLIGHSIDDRQLLETGSCFVTGRYTSSAEFAGIIAAERPDFGFVTSVWPETWCFALSELLKAGLFTTAFAIGAHADRIQAARHGFLLPLGLEPAAINRHFISLAAARRYEITDKTSGVISAIENGVEQNTKSFLPLWP
jgi:hypothetical protein